MATDDQALRGAALRALRALRDLSQTRLAEAAGLSRTTLHRIEHGDTDVPRRYWQLILEELEATPEDLEALVEMARRRGGGAEAPTEEELEDEREAAALAAAVARAYRHQLRVARTAPGPAGETGTAGDGEPGPDGD